jgi:hypothetical protein
LKKDAERVRIFIRGKMRNKTKVISIVLSISALMMFASCQQQKTEWKGTIEYEDGIKVIKNPNEPLHGEIKLELKEDLSIGREDDENYMFYRVRDIALDSHDNIYIMDSGNSRIQKFDSKGQFLQTIGRKGQGPGEFERPRRLSIDSQNNIYVEDREQIKIHDSNGKFRKSISINGSVSEFAVDSEGNIFANVRLFSREELKHRRMFIKVNPEGKVLTKFIEFSEPGFGLVKGEKGILTLSLYLEYHPHLYFSCVNENTFTYGISSEYQIFVIDKDGNHRMSIQKEEGHQTVSRKEKDAIINRFEESLARQGQKAPRKAIEETCDFPAFRSFFSQIMADDKQRIFVRRVKSVLEEGEDAEYDIFGSDGRYLYRTTLPFTPEIIKSGFLYAIHTSEERGEVKVKRYKIKNWDQIKEEI